MKDIESYHFAIVAFPRKPFLEKTDNGFSPGLLEASEVKDTITVITPFNVNHDDSREKVAGLLPFLFEVNINKLIETHARNS